MAESSGPAAATSGPIVVVVGEVPSEASAAPLAASASDASLVEQETGAGGSPAQFSAGAELDGTYLRLGAVSFRLGRLRARSGISVQSGGAFIVAGAGAGSTEEGLPVRWGEVGAGGMYRHERLHVGGTCQVALVSVDGIAEGTLSLPLFGVEAFAGVDVVRLSERGAVYLDGALAAGLAAVSVPPYTQVALRLGFRL